MVRIPDFGGIDTFYLRRRDLLNLLTRDRVDDSDTDFEWDITPIKPIIKERSNDYWFCFLPSFVAIDLESLPREGNVYCYAQPRDAGSAKKGKTRRAEERISEVAINQINDLNLRHEQIINFMAISLGNAPAYYVAAHIARLGFNINRFVSVLPGMDLAWCILNSTITRKVARSARREGYDYGDLADLSPGKNIEGMSSSVTSMEFFLGERDRAVPYKSQRDLADKAVEIMGEEKVKVRTYKRSGHIQTVRRFTQDWQ